MLIGIDMLGMQSPGSRGRGIGRLATNLVANLLPLDPSSRFVFYAHDGLPVDEFPTAPNASVVRLRREASRGETRLSHVMNRLARENPDGLDALLMISPFEMHEGYAPPPRPLDGPALVAVVHDLIPFRFQERYLHGTPHADGFYRRLEGLRHYDVLLANSDATRDDFRGLLALPPGRIATIGAACDPEAFAPDRSGPIAAPLRRKLHEIGLAGPFVYCVTNVDYHKNVFRLIDAFALLSEGVRRSHQLLLTCGRNPDDEDRARRYARGRGLGDRVLFTGPLTDEAMRSLYQRCAAFCVPSLYEGFGLPLLEAMHCGAPVVAGNNTSQVEVVGDAGLLANVGDASDLAEKLAKILTDPDLAADLGERARARAATFSWRATAERAMAAISSAVRRSPSRRLRGDRGHGARPRLAVFSPFPPKKSGISDYAARLIDRLKDSYAIDLYHDSGYVPEPALASPEFGAFDYRLFDRNASAIGYRGILYQMGNSWYHRFIYETMRRHPGIVTLHDYCLAGFQWWYSHERDGTCSHFANEVEHSCPRRAARYLALLHSWMHEPGGIQVACAKRGVYLNRRVFECSRRVIVHSPWCLDQARRQFPELADRATVVPFGTTSVAPTSDRRAATRDRFGLPRGGLVVGSFGYLTRDKMNNEAISAFAAVAGEFPDAVFILVGRDLEGGEARRHADSLGLADRVRFLGPQRPDDFDDLVGAADIGINLRRPPTYGETSAALLDLLRMGVATLVTDVGTFSDYPSGVVRKVRWEADGLGGLIAALRDLAGDPEGRAALGGAALRHVRERHTWEQAAAAYAEAIEAAFAERTTRPSAPRRPAMPVPGRIGA